MTKSLAVTYFLWFFGGFLGLHHFYLGRDRQSFLWWSTLGGYFGLGWISDIWKIPTYVAQANGDKENLISFRAEVVKRGASGPSVSFFRGTGQFLTGNLFGYLALYCLPEDVVSTTPALGVVRLLAFPSFVVVGIDLVGSVGGRQTGNVWRSLAGAYLPLLFFLDWESLDTVQERLLFYVVSASNLVYNWNLRYITEDLKDDIEDDNDKNGHINDSNHDSNTTATTAAATISGKSQTFHLPRSVKIPKKQTWGRFFVRSTVLCLAGCIYAGAVCGLLLYNISIDSEGEQVKIIEAVKNFFKSSAWKEVEDAFIQIWHYYEKHGFWFVWDQFKEALDLGGHQSSCDILGLDCNSYTEKEVRSRCRKLSKESHPDRFRDETEKSEAQEKFMQIQQACSKLSQRRKTKERKNKKDSDVFV